MKKKLFTYIAFVLLIVFATACSGESEGASGNGSGSNDDQETKVLKLAENQPEDYPTTVGAKKFAELVEEKTDGRYKVEVYAGGQLGDEKSVIEQVQLGSIDLARVNATPLTEFSDDIGVLALPYLFKDEESMWKILQGDIGNELLSSLEESQMMGLAFYDSGKRSFYNSVRAVEKPSDLKGMKIRVQQSEMVIDMIKALGASATPMAFEEVYSALQTGVIDGAENNYPSYYQTAHYEVAKYYTLDGHSTVPEVLMTSSKVWNELSEEDKKVFKEAAAESVSVQREAWAELVEESKKKIKENGNEITEVTDVEPWREAVQPVYDKYGKEYQQWIDKIEKAQE